MESNILYLHDNFVVSLLLLLNKLSEKGKTSVVENSKKMTEAILKKELDVDKKGLIIKKVNTILNQNFELLLNRDAALFSLRELKNDKSVKITLIPAIDIGNSWDIFDDIEKNELWTLIDSLYINSVYIFSIIQEIKTIPNNLIEYITNFKKINTDKSFYDKFFVTYPEQNIIIKSSFNPYEGIGTNDNLNYGINDILSGPKLLPDQIEPGIGGVIKLIGIDKMIDIKQLTEQLKNISKEDMETASKQLKSYLGDVDDETSNMIDMMINNISTELKNENNLKDGNINETCVKIAEVVANNITPHISNNSINMEKLWSQTKNVTTKLKDKNGKPLFNEKSNPFTLMTNILESQMKNNNNNNKTNEPNKKQMSQEEIMKECNKMMQNMGLNNLPIDQLMKMKK